MSNASDCDKMAECAGCGKSMRWSESSGGVVTREGPKPVCSHECFLKGTKRPDLCSFGALEDAARAGVN